MIYSMTGYGKVLCNFSNFNLSIEVKSLNSKQIDINCKLPFDFRQKEFAIRNKISGKLKRGKVECIFVLEQDSSTGTANINTSLLDKYFANISELAKKHNLEITDRLLFTALKMPDVVSSPKIEINDETWPEIEKALEEAINKCIEFRTQEGDSLNKDLLKRTDNILQLLTQVTLFEETRISNIRNRISDNLREFIDKSNIDENRFEQELIYYIEKIDISEEKIRLKNHCDYFLETIHNETEVGKKLNFISQEMGREINTLGSKANNSDIQKIVVQMKDELEKIKEQVLNIV